MRVLIVSDIHANLPALQTVFQAARQAGGWDEVWCLGDAVGYGAHPNEVMDLLRAQRLRMIAGNHDLAAIGDLDTDDFNPAAASAAEWTLSVMTREHYDFLAALPSKTVIGDYTLAHGSPREPVWEYVTSSLVATVNLEHFDTPWCFVGHTHVPVIFCWNESTLHSDPLPFEPGDPYQILGHRLVMNPGSVGQPRNGDPRASFALLDTDAFEVTRYAVTYPVREAQAAIRASGLPGILADRLEVGW